MGGSKQGCWGPPFLCEDIPTPQPPQPGVETAGLCMGLKPLAVSSLSNTAMNRRVMHSPAIHCRDCYRFPSLPGFNPRLTKLETVVKTFCSGAKYFLRPFFAFCSLANAWNGRKCLFARVQNAFYDRFLHFAALRTLETVVNAFLQECKMLFTAVFGILQPCERLKPS